MFYPIEKAKGLNDLKDTSIVTPKNNDILLLDGDEWENSDVLKKQEVVPSKNWLRFTSPLRTYSDHGLNLVVNSDDSISINGTFDGTAFSFAITEYLNIPSGTYKLTGGIANGAEVYIGYGNSSGWNPVASVGTGSVDITINNSLGVYAVGVVITASSGTQFNDVFKPMIISSDETDLSWEPHFLAVKDNMWSRDNQRKNGAYNILENNGVSQVISTSLTNLTVTKHGNGEMWIYGTTTTNPIYIYLNVIVNCDEDYMLVGTPPSENPNYAYHVFAPIYRKSDNGLVDTAIDYGRGAIVHKNTDLYCTPQITIKENQTIPSNNPIKFKPMLTTDLNATYDDYVPYAKTNRELTSDIDDLELTTISYNLQSTGLTATTTTGQITAVGMNIMRDKKGNIYRMSGRVVLSGTEANVRPYIEIKHSTFASMKGYWSISGPSLRGSGSTYVACDGCDISHINGSDVISISQNNTLTSGPAGYFMIYFNS